MFFSFKFARTKSVFTSICTFRATGNRFIFITINIPVFKGVSFPYEESLGALTWRYESHIHQTIKNDLKILTEIYNVYNNHLLGPDHFIYYINI